VAREFAPVGLRSDPNVLLWVDGFTTAAQPSGSELPRHRLPQLISDARFSPPPV